MSTKLIANLEKMLGFGHDSAVLRFGLGSAYLKAEDAASAIPHLHDAVRQDPTYSAAWSKLGRALAECGRLEEALAAYRQGIAAAEQRGDKQAAREMAVFSRRLEQRLADGAADS
ncbi:MAG: tetratricopeptide repeat protein [Burkholderiales bacterium]|nr:tetratricopeptide repeat protein [Burkholderiales bacterium]MDQ3196919.1 tetratricopeptide repeat protein [Pseudomonadota bacterium]